MRRHGVLGNWLTALYVGKGNGAFFGRHPFGLVSKVVLRPKVIVNDEFSCAMGACFE
jgi:hypothetical protein